MNPIDGLNLLPSNALEELRTDRDIPPHERMPHALSDGEDENDVKIRQMTEIARINKEEKITLKMLAGQETRPPGKPMLMTEKRALDKTHYQDKTKLK